MTKYLYKNALYINGQLFIGDKNHLYHYLQHQLLEGFIRLTIKKVKHSIYINAIEINQYI